MSNTPHSKAGNGNNNKGNDSSDDWFADLLDSILTGILRLLWWGLRFPLLGAPVAISIGVGVWQDYNTGIFTFAGFIAAYVGWAVLDEASFQQLVIDPPTHAWLRWSRYERSWAQVCALHGLSTTHGDRVYIPALLGIRIGEHTDALEASVVTGQSVHHWHKQTDALAAAWRAERVTVTATTPGRVRITVVRGDRLADPIRLPMPTTGTAVDLAAISAGVTDTHQRWHVPILGHHVLVAGATGAGKGSVLWSLIAALAPEVRTGRVRLCVIDPKGGMELGAGAPMFTAFTHDNSTQTVELLRALVDVMAARANRLRGRTRLHTPTVEAPLLVVVIDEIAALTAYLTDRKLRAEIEQLLALLLSQGRAVGISVIAAVQDPAKDTLPVRQLFTVRIGLRLTESTQTAMVLGAGARDAGAVCDEISDQTPGVGYVMTDGTAHPTRVRAYHVTDADITALARTFQAPQRRTRSTDHDTGSAGQDGTNAHGQG